MEFYEFVILWVIFNCAVYGAIQLAKLAIRKIKNMVNRYLDHDPYATIDPTTATTK